MSDPKTLPSNIKQLERQAEFKRIYKQHTIAELASKLTDDNVAHLSTDDKGDLTWRYLDQKGYDFDKQDYSKPTEGNDNSEATKPLQNDSDSSNGDKPGDATGGEEPVNIDGESNDDESLSEGDGAGESLSGHTDATDDHASTNPSNDNDDGTNATKQSSEMADQAGTDKSKGDNQDEDLLEVAPEAEHVSVTNNGDFSVYEPATRTLMEADETTKIYTTPTADVAKITRNIDQYNQTRGKKLIIN